MFMEYLQLKDVCYINMGQSPDSSSYNDCGEGLPFFQGNADFGERYPVTRVWSSMPTKKANANDILISVRAPIGALNYAKELCCIGRGLAALTPNTEKVSPEFIFWMLKGKNAELNSKGTGSTFKAISKKVLEEIKVPNIDLDTQKVYSGNLEKTYKIIQLRKQQLQQLDELVKSRFVEMFGDPVSNPMGWKKEQLQSNATLLNGRAYKQDELLDGGKYPVLRVGNFFSNRSWYYSDLELDDDKYCDNGDLLYAWSASFGPRIWSGGKVIYHYHIWKVLVGENYNKQFLCNLLDYVTASLMGDTHGIGMMHLTKSGMEETEFIVPQIDLQNQFATFVKQVDKSKFVGAICIDKIQSIKGELL